MEPDEVDEDRFYRVVIAVFLSTGIRVNESTCRKWSTEGMRGVILRTRKFGRQTATKISWVLAFIREVAGQDLPSMERTIGDMNAKLRPVQQAVDAVVGKRVNPVTIWRWHAKGIRNVRLKTYLLGKRRLTTVNDVMAFIEASTAACDAAKSTDVRQALDDELRQR